MARARSDVAWRLARGTDRAAQDGQQATQRPALALLRRPHAGEDRPGTAGPGAVPRCRTRPHLPRLPRRRQAAAGLYAVPMEAERQRAGAGRDRARPGHPACDGAVPDRPHRLGRGRMEQRAVALR
ncbi:hypothetical protein G6F61_013996 [Rhizopus arrhizus]|nr:hypothetical protein G6F61_013996 [Rhizopus arrhizus]